MLKAGDVVVLNGAGCDRVLEAVSGMTFIVDSVTKGMYGDVAHVRDYRYPTCGKSRYCIWSLSAFQYWTLNEL